MPLRRGRDDDNDDVGGAELDARMQSPLGDDLNTGTLLDRISDQVVDVAREGLARIFDELQGAAQRLDHLEERVIESVKRGDEIAASRDERIKAVEAHLTDVEVAVRDQIDRSRRTGDAIDVLIDQMRQVASEIDPGTLDDLATRLESVRAELAAMGTTLADLGPGWDTFRADLTDKHDTATASVTEKLDTTSDQLTSELQRSTASVTEKLDEVVAAVQVPDLDAIVDQIRVVEQAVSDANDGVMARVEQIPTQAPDLAPIHDAITQLRDHLQTQTTEPPDLAPIHDAITQLRDHLQAQTTEPPDLAPIHDAITQLRDHLQAQPGVEGGSDLAKQIKTLRDITSSRLDALAGSLTALEHRTPPDMSQLLDRLDKIGTGGPAEVDLSAIVERLDQIEQRLQAPAQATDLTPVLERLDQLEGTIGSGGGQAVSPELHRTIEELGARAEHLATQIDASADAAAALAPGSDDDPPEDVARRVEQLAVALEAATQAGRSSLQNLDMTIQHLRGLMEHPGDTNLDTDAVLTEFGSRLAVVEDSIRSATARISAAQRDTPSGATDSAAIAAVSALGSDMGEVFSALRAEMAALAGIVSDLAGAPADSDELAKHLERVREAAHRLEAVVNPS